MIEVRLNGLDVLIKKLRQLGAQRIPNYLARAINESAQAAQTKMIEEVVGGLTVRGNWLRPGTKFGMNLTRASKNNLEARVGSRAPWLFQQETTTFKTAHKASFMPVPLPPVRAGRTDPKKIPARLTPKAMGPKLFKIPTRHGIVLAQRLKRAGLRLMYALEKIVHYKRRVHVVDAGVKAAQAHVVKAVGNQIANAIREQGLK
jgi:hypothetical protein